MKLLTGAIDFNEDDDQYNDKARDFRNMSTIEIVDLLTQGVISPSVLSRDVRVMCVDYLLAMGQPVSQIVKLFECSDRTIFRDQEIVHKRYAKELAAEDWQGKFLGELMAKTKATSNYLTRYANSPSTPISERHKAACEAIMVMQKTADIFARLNYFKDRAESSVVSEPIQEERSGGSYKLSQETVDLLAALEPMEREMAIKVFDKCMHNIKEREARAEETRNKLEQEKARDKEEDKGDGTCGVKKV